MSFRRLGLSLLITAAALAGIALVSALLYGLAQPRWRWRWDLSRQQQGSLSSRTTEALEQIPEESRCIAFLLEEYEALRSYGSAVYPRAFQRLRALLEEARIVADGKLEIEILNSQSSPVDLDRAIRDWNRQLGECLILQAGEQRQVIRFEDLFVLSLPSAQGQAARIRQERIDDALGDAVLRLNRKSLPVIALTKANGGPLARNPQLEQAFAALLAAEGYAFQAVDGPLEALEIGADLLCVLGQEQAFAPSQAAAAEQWLQEERPLLLALGPAADPTAVEFWNQQLTAKGLQFEPGLVCQPDRRGMEGSNQCEVLEILPQQMSPQHPVTRRLIEAGRTLVAPGSRPLRLQHQGGSNDYTRDRLLRSSGKAWIEINGDWAAGPKEGRAIQSLALVADRWQANADGRLGRTLLLGSPYMMTGQALALNRDFLSAGVRWLLQEEDQASGLVAMESRPWRPSYQSLNRLSKLAVLALPGLTLLLGLLVFWRRR